MTGNNHTLTKEERDFAAEHHDLIFTHLEMNNLPQDDWYDVLVFGYLEAVRTWHRRPQVRKWAFTTIAKVKMRSAMIGQFRYENRAMRRGMVVSLDAPRQEGEDATLHGLIASSTNMEEQVIFEMLFESISSGLSQKEKAVLQMQTEGFSVTSISHELRLPRSEVSRIIADLPSRCSERCLEAV